VHDIGGVDGFGAIQRETDEPVFHEAWEGRVFGMFLTGAGLPPTRFDGDRHRLERLDPVRYLSSSYYERWLAALESGLIQAGTLSQDEIEARVQQCAADFDLPMPRREDPERADRIGNTLRAGRPASRKIRQKPRFAVGQKIVTRNLNPHGHTRLPRYARSKRGVIVAHHGAHVFPDTNAHGLGENPQHLYTVRITGRELWGDSAEPNECVLVDLWESYLENDKAAIKSAPQKNAPAAKKVAEKTSSQAAKVTARAASSKRPFVAPPASITRSSPGGTDKGKKAGAVPVRDSARRPRVSGKPMRRSR
jgi:nitrile hydratase beta subunit